MLRIGGDEFLLIAENTDTEEAMQLAEKVLHLIQDSYQISGKEINISASLGIALFPEHGQNVQDLLMNADAAMLMSKEQSTILIPSLVILPINKKQEVSQN